MVKNIILDWSGTLVDDLRQVWSATNVALVGCGRRAISLSEFRREFCLPFRIFYQRYLPGIPQKEIDRFFFAELAEIQTSITALPYARTFLRYCQQQGIYTYIVTTVKTAPFTEQARRLRLEQFFRGTLSGIRDKRKAIQRFLRTHHLGPDQTLFVGDMVHDIETAHFVGSRVCAVLTGFSRRDALIAAKPDLLVKNLAELRTHLNSHSTIRQTARRTSLTI